MTRLKFDVSGVDPGGDFKVPKPGSYKLKIDVLEHKTSSNDNPMLEVQYVVVDDKEFEGARVWDYVVLNDNSAWKYRRFLEAVGAVKDGKEKGEINTDALIGTRVLGKLTNESSDEYGTRARLSTVTRLKSSGSATAEEEDLEDEEEDEEADYTYEDIMGMRKTELRDLSKEEELGVRVTKQSKLQTIRERVAEALGLTEEEEVDDDDEEEEVEVEDYNELDTDDLRNECKERGLNPKGSKAALVKRLEEDDEENEPF